MQTDATTPDNTQQYATTLNNTPQHATCKRTRQLPTKRQHATTLNNTQLHATACNRVCKWMQPSTMLRPFARGYVRWQKVATVHNFSNVWSTGKSGCLRLFSLQISINIRESAMHSYNSVSKYWLALNLRIWLFTRSTNCGISLLLVEDQNNKCL